MDKLNIENPFQGKHFFMLPFKKGTKILLRKTVDKFANSDSLKLPKRGIETISFKGGILLFILKVPREKKQRVSIKVTEDFLLVSCSSHTDEKYLTYFASLSLNYLLCNSSSADFKGYY